MTTNPSTKQSIASSIASLALNPAQALGNNIAKMMDTPDVSTTITTGKGQISQLVDQQENLVIASKKHK